MTLAGPSFASDHPIKTLRQGLEGWQPFNTMSYRQPLSDAGLALLSNKHSTQHYETILRRQGLSGGRLGWIKVRARTYSDLLPSIVREAFVAFQDDEFDQYGLAIRRESKSWVALVVVERQSATIDGLFASIQVGQTIGGRALWNVSGHEEGLLSWHVQFPNGRHSEGRCLSNGYCPLPPLRSTKAGELIVQIMVERGLGPEVGFKRHVQVGETTATHVASDPKELRSAKDDPRSPKAQLEDLLNLARRRAQLPPLKFDGLLEDIATKKVNALAVSQHFGHRVKGLRSPGAVLLEAAVPFSRVVESIANGASVESLVAQWLASPAHRAKILDPTLRRAGLGLTKEMLNQGSVTGVLLLRDELS